MNTRNIKDGQFNTVNVTSKGSFDLVMEHTTTPLILTIRYIKQNGMVTLLIPYFVRNVVANIGDVTLNNNPASTIPDHLLPLVEPNAVVNNKATQTALVNGFSDGLGNVPFTIYIGLDKSFTITPFGALFAAGDTNISLQGDVSITYMSLTN
jgi:hypothetical protein